MAFRELTVIVVDGIFGVCRLEPDAPIPSWATAGDIFSNTRIADELSVPALPTPYSTFPSASALAS